MNHEQVDRTLARISRTLFRAKFRLRAAERDYAATRGLDAVRRHAVEFVSTRLAPARPRRDGQQTPWGGHPVFRAQHATATCCRGCLERNHGIAKGHELDDRERAYVIDVICRWIELECGSVPPAPVPPPRLF